MNVLPQNFNSIYLSIVIIISVFYGILGEYIFLRGEHYKKLAWYKKIRKFFIHTSGSAIGFSVLYFLIRKALFCMTTEQYTLMSLTDVLLLTIAIIGIFGLLPWTVHTIATKIDEILSSKRKE